MLCSELGVTPQPCAPITHITSLTTAP
jgi:hypothetical protein